MVFKYIGLHECVPIFDILQLVRNDKTLGEAGNSGNSLHQNKIFSLRKQDFKKSELTHIENKLMGTTGERGRRRQKRGAWD